jgi:hypothetical protein
MEPEIVDLAEYAQFNWELMLKELVQNKIIIEGESENLSGTSFRYSSR